MSERRENKLKKISAFKRMMAETDEHILRGLRLRNVKSENVPLGMTSAPQQASFPSLCPPIVYLHRLLLIVPFAIAQQPYSPRSLSLVHLLVALYALLTSSLHIQSNCPKGRILYTHVESCALSATSP